MPKTVTTYNIRKIFSLSDKGNQMLSELTEIYGCKSEAEFIRNCIAEQVFKLDENKRKKYIESGVHEVVDFYWNYLVENEFRK